VQQRIVKAAELRTMEQLIRQLLGLSVGFFERRTQGELIQAVRQDVSQLRAAAMAAAVAMLDATQGLALMLAAVYLSPSLALWAFLVLPLTLGPLFVLARRTLTQSRGVRRQGVALFDVLLQLLNGIRVIKVFRGEESEARRTIDRARGYFDAVIDVERSRAMARVVLDGIASVGLFAVVIVGGFQVMRGNLAWPSLLAFLMALRAAQTPINSAAGAWTDIQRYAPSVEAIDALLAERPDIADRPDARALAASPRELALDQVSYRIGAHQILRDVSCRVAFGETLGIVGPSGAGKTTLLGMLARFFDPASGAVMLNGEDLRDLRLADVHQHMAIVTQDPFLFQTSVRENIRCGRPSATDAEVEAAAVAADMHEEIQRLPEGYDTLVGHGGRALSRGEAQRLNIARAVLKNAPVLLLDEATSSLDSLAEQRVQQAIDRLMVGRLTVTVAHRLSTLRNATRILVLERGRAVGLGSHEELLDTCATYRALWEAQAAS
jgi:ABC-type multidrug transport system fused ATPase/permease subunit